MAKIHFLNVDEGDCSIIQHDNNDVTMIDICCGNIQQETQKTFSIKTVNEAVKGNFNQKSKPTNPISYLKALKIKSIFRYIQTHPDMDHMDGLNSLAENFSIVNFWDTENQKKQDFGENGKSAGGYLKIDWDCYCKMRKSSSDPKALFYYDGTSNKYFAEDDNGKLNDDYLKILSPTKDLIKKSNEAGDWNDSSYVILYCIQGRKILFCGDSDTNTIHHLIDNHKSDISNLDVLIAPHHGRDSNKDFGFLDVMKPKLTLIGNARSKYLAYDQWNNRNLDHITNNQAGNIVIDICNNGEMHVSCSNQSFAFAYNKQNFNSDHAPVDTKNPGNWCLFYYKA